MLIFVSTFCACNKWFSCGGAHTGRLCKQHLMLKDHLGECGDCVGEMSHSFWKCFFFFFFQHLKAKQTTVPMNRRYDAVLGGCLLIAVGQQVGRVSSHVESPPSHAVSRWLALLLLWRGYICNRESAEFKRFNKTILCVSLYLLPLLP